MTSTPPPKPIAQMRELGSAEDLALRGFSQSEVLALTGIDIGYHASKLRTELSGVDRVQYKIEHVRQRCSQTQVEAALNAYREGALKPDILTMLGLRGENVIKINQLFNGLGFSSEFADADRHRRRETMRAGAVAKFGVDNVFKLSSFQDAAAKTREEKYGAAYTLDPRSSLSHAARETARRNLSDPDFKESVVRKRQQTFLERYGVAHAFGVPEFLEKALTTRKKNHVPKNPAMLKTRPYAEWSSEDFEKRYTKAVVTNMSRYGVEHYSKTQEHRERVRKYFVDLSDEERIAMRDKSQSTNIERYGVPYFTQTTERRDAQSKLMLSEDHQKRIVRAKKQNGTLNSSTIEKQVEFELIEYFGANDVVAQYYDDRYPYACDFYIKSKDMFIEVNGLWTHGPHWYDENSELDRQLCEKWVTKDTAFYAAALEQWCIRDVAKRGVARERNLNYLVLWGSQSVDELSLWLGMGAPNAYDWDREYSWLPDRVLTGDVYKLPELVYGQRRAQQAAKAVNGGAFYARELQLWSENEFHRNCGSVQSRLYVNRFKYLHKTPEELTDVEILNGLGISGVVRRYTSFDADGMVKVLVNHGLTHVYDPCAGWGERLFACASKGVAYSGVDINTEVVAGHRQMIEHYGLVEQTSMCADASTYDARNNGHDAVFTCPPYGDIEIYSNLGAENMSDDDFLIWWKNVVSMAVSPSTCVFAYQINQRWRDRMNEVLIDQGWVLDEQIEVGRNRIGHFNRSRGGKAEFEQIQVFVRSGSVVA